jgi:hypothetical protein
MPTSIADGCTPLAGDLAKQIFLSIRVGQEVQGKFLVALLLGDRLRDQFG